MMVVNHIMPYGRRNNLFNKERAEFRQTLTMEEKLYLLLIIPNRQGVITTHIKNLEEKIRELEDALY